MQIQLCNKYNVFPTHKQQSGKKHTNANVSRVVFAWVCCATDNVTCWNFQQKKCTKKSRDKTEIYGAKQKYIYGAKIYIW